MKTKFFILGLTSVSILSISHIKTSSASFGFLKGPYAGVSVGYAKHKVNPQTSQGASIAALSKVKKFDGVPAGIHFGGEVYKNNSLFASMELGADFIAAHKQTTLSSFGVTTKYKVESGFGGELDLKLGFTSQGVVPYLRVGLNGTQFTQKLSQQSPAGTVQAKKRMFKIGVSPGGGVMYKLNRNWTTGIEYKYAMYKKHELHFNNQQIRIKPRSHDVRLRLSYGFSS